MMNSMKNILVFQFILMFCLLSVSYSGSSQTIALLTFDEQQVMYPSSVISDISDNDYPLVLGQGGRITDGKYGNALEPGEPVNINFPEGEKNFGLKVIPVPKKRTVEPMTWMNARFTALMTSGEVHLRKDVRFAQATSTKLNLGHFDWTVEFWYYPDTDNEDYGVVFEIGEGPRGENNHITRMEVNQHQKGFTLLNQPSGQKIFIPSDIMKIGGWLHIAFVYSSSDRQIRHYVNGKLQPLPVMAEIKCLKEGSEDYFTLCRDGIWQHPLPGRIDELRFTACRMYKDEFLPPSSYSPFYQSEVKENKNPQEVLPLLFSDDTGKEIIVELNGRKHLFIDDAFIDSMH